MFCKKCGKQLDEETLFCPNCGTPQRDSDTPTRQVTNQQTDSKKKIIAIAVAVIILIGLWIANSNGISSNATTSNATTSKVTETIPVIGKWTDANAEVFLYVYEDHTGEMVSGGWSVKCSWEYNKSNNVLTLDFDVLNKPGDVTYNPVKDTLVLAEGSTLFRVD